MRRHFTQLKFHFAFMRRRIIELEVIEFVIKIVLRGIFDFHLRLLPPRANYCLTLATDASARLCLERCLLKGSVHSQLIR
jgi:hypothetical protein